MRSNIELLAPAGDAAALHAAVCAGADAVYVGLNSFNARRGADNFTLATFRDACRYAHMRGVRIYVTLNTIVLPGEVNQALELARQTYRAGADAFIVQDIGIASELTRTLPQARLHLSTQMNVHNLAGIEAAARLGARRVTLARELSLAEIKALVEVAQTYDLEVETFVHGALCICYSGQCFMSSLIGGRSANRGLCAQACRLPYELKNVAQRKSLPSPGEHLLSPKDLCAIDLLPELIEAGVTSFKIEGRMKSPDYVYAVTAAYRAVLDRIGADARQTRATEDEKQALAEAFSRGFTTAYLENARGNEIMSYERPNNRGVFVGRVSSVKNGVAVVETERELSPGDALEFWTNKGHFVYTLGDVTLDVSGGVRTCPQQPVGKGDRVFRVRNAQAAFEDDERKPRIPVQGHATLRLGEPLKVEFELGQTARQPIANNAAETAPDTIKNFQNAAETAQDTEETTSCIVPPTLCGRAEGDIVEPARTKPVSAEDIQAHIDRMGQTPFTLESLQIDVDEGVGIGFSKLHQVRSCALDNLEQQLSDYCTAPRSLPRVQQRTVLPPAHPQGCHIVAWVTNPACARAARRAGAEVLYVPALNYRRGEATVAGQRIMSTEGAGYPKGVTQALPVIEHDAFHGSREAELGFDPWSYVRPGKPAFVESLGDLIRALDLGAKAEVGPHVPITNALSLAEVAQLGASRVWLSPELTLPQITALAQDTPVELGLTIAGSQELMITEHCLLMSQGPCNEDCDACPRRKSPHILHDRKDYEFPVITDALGRSHLYNGVPLDVIHALPDLVRAGLTYFMVDTTLMNVEQTAQTVGRVVHARSLLNTSGTSVSKQPNTTSGHLFRGVA